MMTFYVWGRGITHSALVREGWPSEAAQQAALSHGHALDTPDDWAVEVQASPEELDIQTRFDTAIVAYVSAKASPADHDH